MPPSAPSQADRSKLVRAMATLEAHRQRLRHTRAALQGRAREQLDTMAHPIAVADDFAAAGQGGILTHRYHQALLTERHRLTGIAESSAYGDPE